VLAYVIGNVFFIHLEKQLCRVQVVQLLVSAADVQAVQLAMSAEANAQPFQWFDMIV
jgi:hypothetical protein